MKSKFDRLYDLVLEDISRLNKKASLISECGSPIFPQGPWAPPDCGMANRWSFGKYKPSQSTIDDMKARGYGWEEGDGNKEGHWYDLKTGENVDADTIRATESHDFIVDNESLLNDLHTAMTEKIKAQPIDESCFNRKWRIGNYIKATFNNGYSMKGDVVFIKITPEIEKVLATHDAEKIKLMLAIPFINRDSHWSRAMDGRDWAFGSDRLHDLIDRVSKFNNFGLISLKEATPRELENRADKLDSYNYDINSYYAGAIPLTEHISDFEYIKV